MKRSSGLSATMTLAQFDNGYWYTPELKDFAETLGVPHANKLRKDELEKAIKTFLKTGKHAPPAKRDLSLSGARDVELGLRLDLPVRFYTSNKKTKEFLKKEAQKLAPGLKEKSGARYRLNRWRDEQLAKGIGLTYDDLVKEYVRMNQTKGSFAQIPHGRYINFISDFLAAEKKRHKRTSDKSVE